MYKVFPNKKAVKYYESLDDKTAKRVNKAIEAISKNPLEGPHIKRLRGTQEGKHRYAVGALRIVYRINEKETTILIEAIGPRGDIYK
ncbi:MAG: plasmid stabilization protein [Syntrophobacteraceae bacterium CG23_combo_of_CG06-09_8_20_14_all_50_8]|nr:MAG: plasmid stabilization protein [Syntrophobacteraceae bacterium CG23_combo_of_CG06-09_8_20_14_all_50_8]